MLGLTRICVRPSAADVAARVKAILAAQQATPKQQQQQKTPIPAGEQLEEDPLEREARGPLLTAVGLVSVGFALALSVFAAIYLRDV